MMHMRNKYFSTLVAGALLVGAAGQALANTPPSPDEVVLQKRIKTAGMCAGFLTISEGFQSMPRRAVAQRFADLKKITLQEARIDSWRTSAAIMGKLKYKDMTEQQVAEMADRCSAGYGFKLTPALPRVAAANADGQTQFIKDYIAEQNAIHPDWPKASYTNGAHEKPAPTPMPATAAVALSPAPKAHEATFEELALKTFTPDNSDTWAYCGTLYRVFDKSGKVDGQKLFEKAMIMRKIPESDWSSHKYVIEEKLVNSMYGARENLDTALTMAKVCTINLSLPEIDHTEDALVEELFQRRIARENAETTQRAERERQRQIDYAKEEARITAINRRNGLYDRRPEPSKPYMPDPAPWKGGEHEPPREKVCGPIDNYCY